MVSEFYDEFSRNYDYLANSFEWNAPRILNEVIRRYDFSQKNTLDIGIGTGMSVSELIIQKSDVYGLDCSLGMLNECRNKYNIPLINCDFEDGIPFEKNFFELVISCGVFDHSKNLETIFSEIYRVLKSNGRFIFTVDDLQSKQEDTRRCDSDTEFFSYQHSQGYIERVLSSTGFTLNNHFSFLAYTNPNNSRDVIYRIYDCKQ